MQIRADLTRREVVHPGQDVWTASPLPGVKRLMLDDDGAEAARATSLVRYAVGMRFQLHAHDGGEEFLIVDGSMADEYGKYPTGTYVRNPPGSRHTPRSRAGCAMFLKLRQFDPADRQRVVIDTHSATWVPGPVAGSSIMPLHHYRSERVALVRWEPGVRCNAHIHVGGEEVFVLRGRYEDEHGVYSAGTWVRNPPMSRHTPFSSLGCTMLVKSGHLQAPLA
ncbi:MAG: cupin domain-containing protein [Pseudomonadales bacterium]